MANVERTITEDIRSTMAIGLTAYDKDGTKVGTVHGIDQNSGYVAVRLNGFSNKDLYIPYSLITNIDPRDLFFSKSRADLLMNYTYPPARSTFAY